MSIARMLDRHYDEILAGHSKERADGLVPVDVSPAAEWLLSGTEQETFDFREDFPTIAPPWPFCWLEYLHPSVVHSEGNRIVLPKVAKFRVGLLIGSWRIKPESRREIILGDGLMEFCKRGIPSLSISSPFSQSQMNERRARCADAFENDIEAHWLCLYNLFVEFEADFKLRVFGMFGLYLDELGKPLMDLLIGFGSKDNLASDTDPEQLPSTLIPFFFAISLAHCKNVMVQPIRTASATCKGRHGHDGRIIYRTLNINSLRTIISSEGKECGGKTAIRRALHICRGHFKDYRESGLFGRNFGIYWWNMQARGSKEHGEIKKGYRITGGHDVVQDKA